jgi:peroxiredoxin
MLQKNREISESFKVHGTPGAVVVKADGTIGSPAALGSDAIKALFAQTLYSTPIPVLQNGHAGHNHAGHDHAGHDHAGHQHGSNGQAAAAKLGDPAPRIALPDLGGKTVDLAEFRGSKVLVLFWNQGCGFCSKMLPDLQSWDANRPADAPRLLVVSTGSPDEHKDMNLGSPVVLDPAFSVARTYGANGTPMAVLVDEQGRIASELAAGAEEVLGLANGMLPAAKDGPIQPDLPTARGAGEPAPDFALPDLDGKTVSLAELRGSDTLVLFWNPGCGFCQRLLPDLKQWESATPPGAPKLIVVSSGTAEANRAQGLRSPILLDDGFRVGSSFGASGTPSAVLVDADGKIAAPLGVGGQAVMGLAGGRQDPARA